MLRRATPFSRLPIIRVSAAATTTTVVCVLSQQRSSVTHQGQSYYAESPSETDPGAGFAEAIKAPYRPRVRPRKIVMPVDLQDLHSAGRKLKPERDLFADDDGNDGTGSGAGEGTGGRTAEYLTGMRQLQRQATTSGGVKLGIIPDDRSFAELFSNVFQSMKQRSSNRGTTTGSTSRSTDRHSGHARTSSSSTTTTTTAPQKSDLVSEMCSPSFHLIDDEATAMASSTSPSSLLLMKHQDNNQQQQQRNLVSPAAASDSALQLWDTLEQVRVNSDNCGGLGALALSGRALIELEACSFILRAYPRMRTRHVQTLLHSVVGIEPMLRLGQELGFVQLCGVEKDARLWMELANLHHRERYNVRLMRIHRERQAQGLPSRHTWYYKRMVRGIRNAIRHFPADGATLLPKVEWIRNVIFAFVGWLEHSEGEAAAKKFVEENICSCFEIHKNNYDSFRDGDGDGDGEEEQQKHPLDVRQARRAHRLTTTANIYGAFPDDDPFDRYSSEQLAEFANRRVVEAVDPDNALKEAQFILNYSPYVPVGLVRQTTTKTSVGANHHDDYDDDGEEETSEADDGNRNQLRLVKFDIEIKAQLTPFLETHDVTGRPDPESTQRIHTPKTLEAEFVVWRRRSNNNNNNNKNQNKKKQQEHPVTGRSTPTTADKMVLGRGIGLSEQDAVQAASLDFVRRYYFSPKGRRAFFGE